MRPWVLFSLTLVAVSLFAADGPRAGETIDVSIVNVDAIVTDNHGTRVRGLTRDDFEILENGKPQPITNFTEMSAQGQGQAGELALRTQPRTIIVFVEHFRAPDFRRDPFFNGVHDFLHRTVRPGDAVKIVTFARKAEMRLGFTDNLAAIDRVLEQIRSESGPGVDETTFEDHQLAETFRIGENKARNTFRFMRMRDKIAAITSLMNSVAGVDSKKVFIMAVRYFNPAGVHDLTEIDSLLPGYGWSSRHRGDAMIDYVAKTANANGITVYPLYPEGLGSDRVGVDALFDFNINYSQLPYLDQVARQTGGKLAWGRDIEKDLPKMADDLDAYYSLGYRATNHHVDRARSIVVRPKNPDYSIRARREYVEKSDQTRMRERVLATLFDQQPASSMRISVEVGKPRYVHNGQYSLPLTVYIPTAALMTDGGRGEFSVFVGWSGTGGEIGEVTKQSQKFNLMTDMPENFTYTFDIAADNSTDRLSIGVFDEISKDYGLRRIELAKSGKVAGLR